MCRKKMFISAFIATTLLPVIADTASAQNVGNPTILEAVQNLQASVSALQSTVNNVQTGVGSLSSIQSTLTTLQQAVNGLGQQINTLNQPNQVKVRFTPPANVAASGDISSCIATNISAQARTIHTEIVTLDNTVAEDLGTVVVQPGHGTGGGNRGGDFFYCRFTVVDGTRADIRGSMIIGTNTTIKQTVPAE